jgi:sec-independent protein translocase protein TatB
MFDLSWTEILVIGTAALIFIGPKELPGALRSLGQLTGKARDMAREFRGTVDDMIRESEIHELKNQVDKLGSGDLQRSIEKAVDPTGEIDAAFKPPEVAVYDTPALPTRTAAPAEPVGTADVAPSPSAVASEAPPKPTV